VRRLPAALAVSALLAWPAPAHAHLVTTGLGPVYDGVSHLLLTFDDLLPVLAMAALSGLNGPAAGRRTLFVLPAAWLAAGLAGHACRTPVLPAWTTAVSLLAVGILVAADRRLPPGVVTFLTVAVGIVHGWMNGASLAADGRAAGSLAGIAAAIFVLAALVSAFVASLRRPWTRIAVRAAGSWMAAIGLLFLGWILSGRG